MCDRILQLRIPSTSDLTNDKRLPVDETDVEIETFGWEVPSTEIAVAY